MTEAYTLPCECGDEARREFRQGARPGLVAGFQCPGCNRILLGQIPGEGKYQREKTRALRELVLRIFQEQRPTLTVRQLYYALTVKGAVPKTEAGYRQTANLLASMRRDGALPYGWIADNTRWQRKPVSYSGLGAALERMQESYRRDLWAYQPAYVEIWIEKDALAGVAYPVTSLYDVPLMVARGYGSMTFIHDAAEALKEIRKPIYIYHFGDFDPSGVDAAEKIKQGLRDHGASIYFERMAITPEQIEAMGLQTRPTKSKDPRAKKWGYSCSCELDAMPAPVLRDLVRECIERHIDPDQLERSRAVEESERRTLASVLQNFVPVQES